MDQREPQKAGRHIGNTLKIALLIILWTPMNMVGCSRQEPPPNPESQPATLSKANTKADAKLTCPPGDPADNDASSSPSDGHTVSLSWNASTSANNSKGTAIQYCLYRTKGGRVQRSTRGRTISPCVNCQRVTKEPVTGVTYQDTHIENDSHYCYVAIAIETVSSLRSDFSNQTEADIPKAGEPVSSPISSGTLCNPKGQHDKSSTKQSHR